MHRLQAQQHVHAHCRLVEGIEQVLMDNMQEGFLTAAICSCVAAVPNHPLLAGTTASTSRLAA
jgi:hypothetical protein